MVDNKDDQLSLIMLNKDGYEERMIMFRALWCKCCQQGLGGNDGDDDDDDEQDHYEESDSDDDQDDEYGDDHDDDDDYHDQSS